MQVANITALGNIGTDPELRQTGGGLEVLNFSVAVNSKRRDEETTAWYRVAVFGPRAAALGERLAKGQLVYIAGRLEPREYEGREGGTRTSLDVTARAEDVVIASGHKPQGQPSSRDAVRIEAVDDLPF